MVAALAKGFVDGQIGGSILLWNDEQRRVGFKNLEHIYPTRRVAAGTDVYALGSRPMDLAAVTYAVDGETFTIKDFLGLDATIGVLVVQNDDVVMEHYAEGNDEQSVWVSFSVTKSVTSMLIGAAIADGLIESVDESVVDYLPRLRGTPYEGSSIKDVLQMASGVAWNEDYTDPESDVARAGGLNGIDLIRYLAKLPRAHAPGEVFNYNTGETNLAGEILRSAIGNNAATYLSAKIWRPFGMQQDANWVIGSLDGGELGGCCISATLRDYARLGIFALRDGVLASGERVLPQGWMEASTEASKGYDGYGYFWWLQDTGSYQASGIFGQKIYIDPARNLVIALHSNAQAAVGSKQHAHISAAIDAIAQSFSVTN